MAEEEKEVKTEIESINNEIVKISPFYSKKKGPSWEQKIVYDSSSETLEPVYFWILDKMSELVGKPEKLVDSFASSPGSGHFSELRQKATIMQDQAMKILQTNGVLIKSLINIIYDLKEFQLRLSQYEKARSKDKNEQQAAMLALKQIWMDNVDIKRGQGSINALSSGNLSFVTLRDAFMASQNEKLKGEDGKDIDLNDRVKRILQPRIQEFLLWKQLSEKELIKRYEIERTYLKNQLNSLKLYTKWAKPYLRAAAQLENKNSKDAGLVTAFNTVIFELALFSKKAIDPKEEAVGLGKRLPEIFLKTKMKRKYYYCVLADIYFRGIPQKVGQHYVFGGKVEATFRGYALNDEELALLNKRLDETDLSESLALAKEMTDESLKQLQEDISYFLKQEEEEKKKKAEEKSEDVNPFVALLGLGDKKEKKDEKKKEIKKVNPDNYLESILRAYAEADAKDKCFTLFDVYKKAHGMQSHPAIEFEPELRRVGWKDIFKI
ncbi:hypothetical protein HYW76_03975 [Candidatus Pacearchaeota archaeon]|nr:hypothetical protein [Candidatus Pacearchaeota archaeon]